MYDQMSLLDIPSATFSPELESGPSRCVPVAGPTTAPSGPAPVLASLSARQAKAMGLLTSGTYGPPSTTSSASAALQKSVESRLRAKLSMLGSTLYTLTWKPWVTPSGVSRFRLRASVRRTSGTETTGPAGWPTPAASDGVGGKGFRPGVSMTGRMPDGSKVTMDLSASVKLAMSGWPSPGSAVIDAKAVPPIMGNRKPTDPQIGLADVAVHLAGWPTPTVADVSGGGQAKRAMGETRHGSNLNDFVMLTKTQGPARLTASGQLLTGSSAGMESGGQLSPAHSLWLQLGPFATEWLRCAELGMRSTSRRRKPSLKA